MLKDYKQERKALINASINAFRCRSNHCPPYRNEGKLEQSCRWHACFASSIGLPWRIGEGWKDADRGSCSAVLIPDVTHPLEYAPLKGTAISNIESSYCITDGPTGALPQSPEDQRDAHSCERGLAPPVECRHFPWRSDSPRGWRRSKS